MLSGVISWGGSTVVRNQGKGEVGKIISPFALIELSKLVFDKYSNLIDQLQNYNFLIAKNPLFLI